MNPDEMRATLDDFRVEVMVNLADLDVPLDVIDDGGNTTVVVALGEELLSTLMRRVANAGGYANVFVKSGTRVRSASILPMSEALTGHLADDLRATPPMGIVSVDAFLDMVALSELGVVVPALLPPQAAELKIQQLVKDAREVEFANG